MRIPFLRPKDSGPTEHPVLSDVVEPAGVVQARTHARQRLTGALVLLVLGVLLFPLLFETQPRPLGVDVPIVTTARDNTVAATAGSSALLPLPVGSAPARAATPPAPPPVARVEPWVSTPAVVSAVVPSAPPAPPVVKSSPPKTVQATPAVVTAVAPAAATTVAPAAAPAASAPGPAAEPRFVVQAGAYGEATALREARQKVEKLGLKTFIQVIDNGSGKRTRVRVGPFPTRQEAEAVAAKVKAAGLQANVLAL